jgi:hypothetical protein
MEMIADTGRLASLDFCDLNPALDQRNTTAELAVDIRENLFGKSTLIRANHPLPDQTASRPCREFLQAAGCGAAGISEAERNSLKDKEIPSLGTLAACNRLDK